MQSITGIPYYYRQFGYEMTVNLGGGRKGYLPHIPKLKEDETEPFQIRQATVADIPLLQELYRYACKRSLLSTLRDEAMWRYELADQHDEYRGIIAIIESLEGEAVGFIWHGNNLWGSGLGLFAYELKPGASWVGVTPTVIRYLAKKGEEYAEKDDKKDFHSYNFNLVSDHPALAISEKYLPEIDHPYAWYIRIPDIPGFLSHISPVLEKRLEDSDLAGYRGELLLDFHRSGVKMVFENGKLTASEPWQPSTEDRGDLAFPDLAFLHLLFGYKAFTELESMFVDCYRREKPESPFLADILFPKKPSHLNAIM